MKLFKSNRITIKMASDFTEAPGARYRTDGSKSGEEFYEDILLPRLAKSYYLTIDLDGTWGYATSFLSEIINRLLLEFDKTEIKRRIKFVSCEDEQVVRYIKGLIDENE